MVVQLEMNANNLWLSYLLLKQKAAAQMGFGEKHVIFAYWCVYWHIYTYNLTQNVLVYFFDQFYDITYI